MKSILFYLTFTLSVFCGTAPQYTIIDIPAPPTKFKNIQIDGLTFLPNGKLVVCLPSGEIFFRDLKAETWALFAEGLHNPLGVIARSNSELIIAQRPELTRVRDLDGDGKADDFEVVTDDFGMSGNYHEFNFTPVLDTREIIFLPSVPDPPETECARLPGGFLMKGEDRAGCTHPPPTVGVS